LEEADNWGIVSSAAELTEEADLEQWTALGEQEEEDSNMSRPKLTVNAPKKGVQVVDTSDSHFFEFDQFMDRCLKYKHEMEAVITLYMLCRWHSNQDPRTRKGKELEKEYAALNKEIKKSVRRDHRAYADRIANEAQAAANQGNIKGMFKLRDS